jgi:hypothetical protein
MEKVARGTAEERGATLDMCDASAWNQKSAANFGKIRNQSYKLGIASDRLAGRRESD